MGKIRKKRGPKSIGPLSYFRGEAYAIFAVKFNNRKAKF